MNRIQNESVISLCSDNSGSSMWECNNIYMQQQHNGWIEIAPPPLFSSDRTSFISILPSAQASSLRNYKHIGKQEVGGSLTFLTAGEFVVTEILSWDEAKDTIYFMGTMSEGPGARHLYSVTGASVTCLTCEIRVSRNLLIGFVNLFT